MPTGPARSRSPIPSQSHQRLGCRQMRGRKGGKGGSVRKGWPARDRRSRVICEKVHNVLIKIGIIHDEERRALLPVALSLPIPPQGHRDEALASDTALDVSLPAARLAPPFPLPSRRGAQQHRYIVTPLASVLCLLGGGGGGGDQSSSWMAIPWAARCWCAVDRYNTVTPDSQRRVQRTGRVASGRNRAGARSRVGADTHTCKRHPRKKLRHK